MATPKQKSLVREIMDVLKEQRALLAFMLAYAAFIASAPFAWQKILGQWRAMFPAGPLWILFVYSSLPVLVPPIFVIVRRWRRATLERRLADVSKDPLKFKFGHFRTTPYGGSEEDRKAYERTDHAHEQALGRIGAAAEKGEPFFFLHSQSGCGKTSLLQAFVMPALEKQDWRVIALRGFGGILPELAKALGLAETVTTDEIRGALAAEAEARHAADGTLLVVVDQFEEFLILHPQENAQWQAAREWFTALRGEPVPGLQVLLSLRSEYQTSALKLGLPDFDSARSFVVPLFTAEDARNFLRRGLEGARKKTGELPLDQFIQQMEDRDDTRGMVRPIQANLVGHAYRTYAAEFHARLLAGKRVDFLADWLHRLLERRELRLHARPIFQGLLQKDGSRCPARVAQIAAEAELDADVVRHCLSAFENEGLVRCLTPDLPDDRQKLWEISHDFLAVQIKRLLSFWRGLWQESLARAVAPAAVGLWLLAAVGFLVQDMERVHIARLADLGLHWDRHARKAAVIEDSRNEMNAATLAKAAPSLQTLRCRELRLSRCEELHNIDCLKGLTALTSLDLSWCENLQNVDVLKSLTTLASLDLKGCKNLQNVDVLKGLTALRRLDLSFCRNLQNVDVLESLTALTGLSLEACENLQNLDVIKGLTALTSLDLAVCQNLQNVDGLKGLTALTSLNLNSCYNLKNLDVLRGLTALTSLNLSELSNLKNVDVLKGLTALTSLDLSECRNLQSVDALKGLTALTSLDLRLCTNLQNVDALKGLTALTRLDLYNCNSLQNVDVLKGLTALSRLDLSGCPNITEAAVQELRVALPKTEIVWRPEE